MIGYKITIFRGGWWWNFVPFNNFFKFLLTFGSGGGGGGVGLVFQVRGVLFQVIEWGGSEEEVGFGSGGGGRVGSGEGGWWVHVGRCSGGGFRWRVFTGGRFRWVGCLARGFSGGGVEGRGAKGQTLRALKEGE